MPTFRKNCVVDNRFNGDVLKTLRDRGHGFRLVLADRSFDVREVPGLTRLAYPGNTAQALRGVLNTVNVEPNSLQCMMPDPGGEPVVPKARGLLEAVAADFKLEVGGLVQTQFYEQTYQMPEQTGIMVNESDLAFNCLMLQFGHSQK